MTLFEIVNFEIQQRNVLRMRLNAQRQAEQAKAAQARLIIQKARQKMLKAQQQLNLAMRAVNQNP